MSRIVLSLAFVVAALCAACGGSSSSSSGSSNPTAAPQAAATTVVATPATAPTVAATTAAGGPPAAGAATRVNGTVQSVTADNVPLSDGTSFQLAPTARVLKQTTITASDLKVGQFVAITAKRQPDNTLLASIVSIFPESLKTVPAGQRPLPEGDLMTNATIDTISGSNFTVAFPGGGAKIMFAPAAQIIKQDDAKTSDITPGAKISASVTNGVAMALSIL